MITLYIIISIILSYKFRGVTFPESEKEWHEEAERLKKRPSFKYVLDENNNKVKVPSSDEAAEWQAKYEEVYNTVMKACDNAKGKHYSDGKLHGDDFTFLVENMVEYRKIIAEIMCRERGSQPERIEKNEHFIISDDKKFIFMMFNALYRCKKALKKDKAEFSYLVNDTPMFFTNPHGLPKRFTDVERYMLEHGWNPMYVFALNRITGPIIKHIKEPFPLVDKKDSIYNYKVSGFSGFAPDPKK